MRREEGRGTRDEGFTTLWSPGPPGVPLVFHWFYLTHSDTLTCSSLLQSAPTCSNPLWHSTLGVVVARSDEE